MPEFYGLSFVDLGAIMIVLHLSLIFSLRPLVSVLFCGVSVLAVKIVRKNFDLIGWMVPRRQYLYVKDVKRGEE